jgi:hypothetical protein
MCKLIKEAKQLRNAMKKIDLTGSYHHRIFLDFSIKQFKKGEIKAGELIKDTQRYKKQYYLN